MKTLNLLERMLQLQKKYLELDVEIVNISIVLDKAIIQSVDNKTKTPRVTTYTWDSEYCFWLLDIE